MSAVVVLAAACGSGGSTSPETFFEDLETAVVDFSADLDDVDADYRGKSWDVPDAFPERGDFVWETELAVLDEYIDVWGEYVDRLDALQPPEGFPEAGEGYADGLPEYFEEAIVDTERAALEAVEERRAALAEIDDPELFWSRDLPDEQIDRLDAAFEAIRELDDLLEDEWESFEDSADAVGHPIDDAVDVRIDMDFLTFRASGVVSDILDAAASG
jgi:hypothetical protein